MTDRPLLHARRHSERPHVLIVTDDPGLATFLREGLPLGGFWTTVIASGIQVLEVFRLRQFDLIVLDWGLQSFDPLELVRRLRGVSTRADASTPRTTAPVVGITEHPVDLPPGTATDLGIDGMLTAPIELDDLVPELHAIFEAWRNRYPSVPMSDDPLRENR